MVEPIADYLVVFLDDAYSPRRVRVLSVDDDLHVSCFAATSLPISPPPLLIDMVHMLIQLGSEAPIEPWATQIQGKIGCKAAQLVLFRG